jgi:predicted nucleotidyltransferase
MNLRKIKLLKKYFEKEPSVSFAFLLGSQIKDRARAGSDWDVAVYFKPNEYLELEKETIIPMKMKFGLIMKQLIFGISYMISGK